MFKIGDNVISVCSCTNLNTLSNNTFIPAGTIGIIESIKENLFDNDQRIFFNIRFPKIKETYCGKNMIALSQIEGKFLKLV